MYALKDADLLRRECAYINQFHQTYTHMISAQLQVLSYQGLTACGSSLIKEAKKLKEEQIKNDLKRVKLVCKG